jgi:hypothetical protein
MALEKKIEIYSGAFFPNYKKDKKTLDLPTLNLILMHST